MAEQPTGVGARKQAIWAFGLAVILVIAAVVLTATGHSSDALTGALALWAVFMLLLGVRARQRAKR